LLSIAPHVVAATVLAESFSAHLGPLAVSKAATEGIGGLALIALAVIGLVLAAIASAARGVAAAMIELLRLAAVTMAITALSFAIVLGLLYLLIHN
jgi:hypothetical protein